MTSPKRDPQTVTPEGKPVKTLPHGVVFRPSPVHVDERGELFEMFDERWDWHKDPLVFAYITTVRPGITKGWGIHKVKEDRYFIISGDLEVVFYDDRKDSPTYKQVSKFYHSEKNRGIINIPVGIWHAIRNVGQKDVMLANFPTKPYNHEKPDKYRLPLNTPKIPYKFDNPKGW